MPFKRCKMYGLKILLLLLLFVLISGCITAGPEKAPKALFDMGHGEIFPPNDGKPSSYTGFYYQFYSNGYDVGSLDSPITKEVLSGAKVLVAAGPMRDFSVEEITSIKDFVRKGGNLLILVHIFPPVNALAQEFGISVSSNITAEAKNVINSSSQDFFIMDFEEHPITLGIKKVAVYGTWSVISNEPAKTVAWTSDSAWPDIIKNKIFDPDIENREKLGIIAVAEYGRGKVLVLADDAIFIERFMNDGDNRRFGENIIKWFKGSQNRS